MRKKFLIPLFLISCYSGPYDIIYEDSPEANRARYFADKNHDGILSNSELREIYEANSLQFNPQDPQELTEHHLWVYGCMKTFDYTN